MSAINVCTFIRVRDVMGVDSYHAYSFLYVASLIRAQGSSTNTCCHVNLADYLFMLHHNLHCTVSHVCHSVAAQANLPEGAHRDCSITACYHQGCFVVSAVCTDLKVLPATMALFLAFVACAASQSLPRLCYRAAPAQMCLFLGVLLCLWLLHCYQFRWA